MILFVLSGRSLRKSLIRIGIPSRTRRAGHRRIVQTTSDRPASRRATAVANQECTTKSATIARKRGATDNLLNQHIIATTTTKERIQLQIALSHTCVSFIYNEHKTTKQK